MCAWNGTCSTDCMATVRHVQLRRYQQIVGLLWRHRAIKRADPSEEKARQLADDLEKLGPTFIKLGQLLSSRPDLVPPEYVKALTHLQDHVAPFDVMMLEAIIE